MTDKMNTEIPATGPGPKVLPLSLKTSPELAARMHAARFSFAISTYQYGKVLFVGTSAEGGLTLAEASYGRAMGMCFTGNDMYLASNHQIWRLVNFLPPGGEFRDHDRVYGPRMCWFTGAMSAHDLNVDADGNVVFINTAFNCIAAAHPEWSFRVMWAPPFMGGAKEYDRCHLNGLAMRDGRVRYVTLVAESDEVDGWRSQRVGGGAVYDVQSNEAIVRGLSMPHSPRWHRDALYILDAATGFFGRVDLAKGRFEPMAFVPGFARGMAFLDNYAVIGLSLPRRQGALANLPIGENMGRHGFKEPSCGLALVDIRAGKLVHVFRIEGSLKEIYDVAVLHGTRRPWALSPNSKEVEQMILFQ